MMSPSRLPFRVNLNLTSRILLLFLALLLAIQGVSFALIRQAIEANARSAVSAQLEVGERVFLRVLSSRATRAADATELLVADFGFRSALASNDQETIASALENQRARAKASFAYYLSTDFKLVGTSGVALSDKAMAGLRYPRTGNSLGAAPNSALVADGDQIIQYVMAPVKTPTLVGWVAMGYPLGQDLLDEVKSISGFDAALAMARDGGAAKTILTSLDTEAARNDVSAALARAAEGPAAKAARATMPTSIAIGSSTFGARQVPLSSGDGVSSFALLMQSIDKAREPYSALQTALAALGAGGCAAFAFGALLLARSISRPIANLSKAAESLALGDYGSPIGQGGPGEVGELASSFERMRQAMGEREGKIQRLAYWDALTELPNREQFRERLAEALASGADGALGACAVAYLDVDRIKNVNHALGQHAGDELLREVARRLRAVSLPEGGLAARITGDKFALLIPGGGVEEALEAAERVHLALREPATISASRIDVSAGIGVCCAPEHAQTAEQALARAEVAMYAGKLAKSPTTLYNPALDSSSDDSLSLLSDLRVALERGDLRLHYQAKADLDSGEIIGAEALARWNHPLRGAMPPNAFIPFAEQTGFIGQITQWAVAETCMMIARSQAQGLRLKISANISTRDLIDPQFLGGLRQSLARSGADATLLCLELTESALMDNPERSLRAMAEIRALGVELSIDDFGTGYSSLSYLRKMPINELKIDRVFVLGLTSGSPADEKIVYSTIDLAHGLGLRVVAEGTEDPQAFAKLRAAGCDVAQGFGISRPIAETAFLELAKSWTPSRMPGRP